jgi:hypothetical protein
MSDSEQDATVEALVARGLVPAAAVAHARAVALRGHASVPLTELLVELEHLAPEDLASVPVATPSPVGLVPSPEPFASSGRDPEPDHVVRLTNAFLLRSARIGSVFRIEVGDPAFVRSSEKARFDDAITMARGAEVARRMIARLREMAGIRSDAPSASGSLLVHAGRADLAFRVDVERTDAGLRAIVRRHSSWTGHGPPEGLRWDRYRKALARAVANEKAASGWRDALREAEALGAEATIERVTLRAELATALDREGDLAGASLLGREALALAEELSPGVRALGALCAHAASMESVDLDRRAALFDRAEAWLTFPGPGRGRTAMVQIDLAILARIRVRHEAARDAAERAHADELSWFGARTQFSVRALVESALASAALGDTTRAQVSAREASRAIDAIGVPRWEADWALGAALGPTREGIALLERARDGRPADEREEDAPFIALTLAKALALAKRFDEAASVARRVDRFVGLAHAARTELEAIASRAPYR